MDKQLFQLKTLLGEGLTETEFYGDLRRKIITRYRRIGYNLNVTPRKTYRNVAHGGRTGSAPECAVTNITKYVQDNKIAEVDGLLLSGLVTRFPMQYGPPPSFAMEYYALSRFVVITPFYLGSLGFSFPL